MQLWQLALKGLQLACMAAVLTIDAVHAVDSSLLSCPALLRTTAGGAMCLVLWQRCLQSSADGNYCSITVMSALNNPTTVASPCLTRS
jgi:hypothetical protein